MKPKHTWILVANARVARIVEHRGAGHGLFAAPGMVMHADEPVEYADKAGTGHSIAGPGTPALGTGDPQEQAEAAFANEIIDRLAAAQAGGEFDRLVIIASPHMLGLLRKHLGQDVKDMLVAELDKDLTAVPLDELKAHLDPVFLV